MFRLAALWGSRGERVICATTTRIWPPAAELCAELRVDDFQTIEADLRRRPSPMVTVASRIEGGKCCGFSADDTLSLAALAQHLIVEADGSAGRPLKAHAAHEPVIAGGASCVVAVVGSWCVGTTLDPGHVHRPERFAMLSGRAMGSLVTAEDVARVILHEEGWLRAVPPRAAFHVVVTGVDRGIARALEAHAGAGRIAGVHCE